MVEPLVNIDFILQLLVQVLSLYRSFFHLLDHKEEVEWMELCIVPAAESTYADQRPFRKETRGTLLRRIFLPEI